MATVEESWARVTEWLAVHAPASYATLRPPASAAEQHADGTHHVDGRFLPGGYRLLSAAEVAWHSRSTVEIMSDLGFPGLMGSWWHPQWVMFGLMYYRVLVDDAGRLDWDVTGAMDED